MKQQKQENKKQYETFKIYLKENKTELFLILLGAVIGGLLGLMAYNKDWL